MSGMVEVAKRAMASSWRKVLEEAQTEGITGAELDAKMPELIDAEELELGNKRSGRSFSKPGRCVFCGRLVMVNVEVDEDDGDEVWECCSQGGCEGWCWVGEGGVRAYIDGETEYECPPGCLLVIGDYEV